MPMDSHAMEQCLTEAKRRLLAARVGDGHWEGELSGSALSTATAACALAVVDRIRGTDDMSAMVRQALAWLRRHQNPDGGWGDTVRSPSNVSTSTLCWAAIGACRRVAEGCQSAEERVEDWLRQRVGNLTPSALAQAIRDAYGNDRTFSIPILTTCVLAGRFGEGVRAWRHVPALPFELAVCPHTWFRWLRLPVVSYALPALIAIGQVRHHHLPTKNPLTRSLRWLTRSRTLSILGDMQPESGGFLEATPITSFVVMSLASAGSVDHPVVEQGVRFLTASMRGDGSWPIDTNLATWVTTLSVNALADETTAHLNAGERDVLCEWLLGQQHQVEHPYTHAAPGGWAWTNLSGGVPDADDTAGALLALHRLSMGEDCTGRMLRAVTSGVCWLLDLQNSDGGIPTFCRGWGRMPFDRSTPDLTAHTLRAWSAWRERLSHGLRARVDRATHKAVEFLVSTQRADGTWAPLWFGSQASPSRENPLYGTTRVLRATEVVSVDGEQARAWKRARRRGVAWVLLAQNSDGGWGGGRSVPSSIEETALASEALAGVDEGVAAGVNDAIERGCAWLVEHTDGGTRFDPSPIGLYFAKLWYHERLYPLIFTVVALERVTQHQSSRSNRQIRRCGL
ncbi:MAG: prenyltransferase/squalene oxidase repeat-containing protein [Planctomycetota bacterium]